jgi:hypothetical protein
LLRAGESTAHLGGAWVQKEGGVSGLLLRI